MAGADDLSNELRVFVSKVVGRFGTNLVESLREETPKDTGHAQSNWVGGVGTPRRGPFGSRKSVSYQEQAEGLAAFASYDIRQGTVYVINDVHYVPIIDAIHARAGFVLRGIEKAISKTEGEFK